MKKTIFILTLAAVAVVMTGCKDYLDVNTSKDAPVTVICEEVLPALEFYTTQQVYDFAEYGVYLSQCLTTGGKATTSSYAYKCGWGGFLEMNRHPQWRRHYYDVGVNAQYMIADAEKGGKRNYIMIARTLQLNSLMLTTDIFGEMPRSKAYTSNNPPYDSQQSIYDYLEQEFQAVMALYDDPEWIDCPTNGVINSRRDRMYNGDMRKWRAFTKALYCRFLVRQIPNMNNTQEVRDKIIALVDEVLNDPDWAEPLYKFDGGSAEANCQWGPSMPKMNLGWAQARDNLLNSAIPSRFFGSILGFYPSGTKTVNSLSRKSGTIFALDPRATRMMHYREDGSNTKALRSLQNNIGMDVSMKVTYYPDLYCNTLKDSVRNNYRSNPYTRDDGYIAYITEEELLFIKAEAQYWSGNKAEAYNTTKQAVERSMARYSVRGNMGDPSKVDEDFLIDLFYQLRLPADNFTIANLMQQKYVAMYLQPEQWCDIRRYNYSSPTNGIMYDNVYVYHVDNVYDLNKDGMVKLDNFNLTFDLTRPYNIYEAHWMTPKDMGTNFKFTANAWINRISPDPETEEKYNRAELEKLGAYKNPDWLRMRMIWQCDVNSNGAITSKGEGEWMSVNQNF